MKLRVSLLLLIILGSAFAKAQTARKYSNEFLNIGVDAAAFGMANAVVALTGDVNSGYWNPAGLMKTEKQEFALMHASYFANIASYDYAGYSMPLDDRSSIGASIVRFGVDDILNTTQLIDANGNIDYNRISLFSTADYAFTISYARDLPLDGLTYGINAKVIRRVIGEFANSWGFGLDLGVQFERNDWHFGAMVRDITTTYNSWSIDEDKFANIAGAVAGQNQELPETTEITLPKMQLGVGRIWTFHHDHRLSAELDLNVRFTQTNDLVSTSFASFTPALGLEYGFLEMVFVRAGVGNFQEQLQLDGNNSIAFQPNLGIGFKYKGIQIDYALTDIGDQSAALYSNVFSLKMDFSIFK